MKNTNIADLTSNTWEELKEKLKKVIWDGIPIIHAKRMNGKIVVMQLWEIPLEVEKTTCPK